MHCTTIKLQFHQQTKTILYIELHTIYIYGLCLFSSVIIVIIIIYSKPVWIFGDKKRKCIHWSCSRDWTYANRKNTPVDVYSAYHTSYKYKCSKTTTINIPLSVCAWYTYIIFDFIINMVWESCTFFFCIQCSYFFLFVSSMCCVSVTVCVWLCGCFEKRMYI